MKPGDKMSFTFMPDGVVIMRVTNRQVSDLARPLYQKGRLFLTKKSSVQQKNLAVISSS